MKNTFVSALTALASSSLSSAIPLAAESSALAARQSCENTATSRSCWGDYSIDTNYYETVPNTGVTREYWLSIQNETVNADGYNRQGLTINGTIPGPEIIADWGDNLIIHVTNNMEHNGTTLHWHGIRQLNSVEYDGVPGVTQCPIAPGDSLSYKFHATQYGTSWYHSHFILQYGDGVQGPIIINGPATADYDEDLGAMFLSDWSHIPAQQLWDSAKLGGPPSLENGLINGTNTYDCSTSTDPNCVGGGVKNVNIFESGKKYRLRLVNSAVDGHFQFSIDGHSFTVIANDFVPIVPYETDNLSISIGQRYDIIVDANATVGDYWLRAGWVLACGQNGNADEITAIIRYDASSTADPTTTSAITTAATCGDEPAASLVPHLAMNVEAVNNFQQLDLGVSFVGYTHWLLNGSSLLLDWADPTTLKVFNNESIFPTEYNVQPLENTSAEDIWTYWVIEDDTGFGITHPLHLHGHDFWLLAQDTGMFNAATVDLKLVNPPRRDVASLPGNGYIVMAFKKDNPGSWLMHCHIAWHASEGFAMQFVESPSHIADTMTADDVSIFGDTCATWDQYDPLAVFQQDDSGI
ncbi:putative laccase-2 [Amylocarpus encephaloides]|uniref:laccase n=1 Tax=Amylocarpus encephaloides TaxID=45428 RepID=A0A9P8C637_9HELO|nr:putative laccase-2 [Amylocarpus encephaloides]